MELVAVVWVLNKRKKKHDSTMAMWLHYCYAHMHVCSEHQDTIGYVQQYEPLLLLQGVTTAFELVQESS